MGEAVGNAAVCAAALCEWGEEVDSYYDPSANTVLKG